MVRFPEEESGVSQSKRLVMRGCMSIGRMEVITDVRIVAYRDNTACRTRCVVQLILH